MAKRLGVRRVEAKGDSKLVVMQVEGKWKVNAENLRPLREAVVQEVRGFESFKIGHIPRCAAAVARESRPDGLRF